MLVPTPYHLDLRTLNLPHRSLGQWQNVTFPILKSSLWRFLHHKRWLYLWVNGQDWLLGIAVVDLGYMAKAFVFMAEKAQQKAVFREETLFLPRAGHGVFRTSEQRIKALAATPHLTVRIHKLANGALDFHVEGRDVRLWGQAEAPLDPLLVAVSRLNDGGPNLTAKGMAHPGWVEIQTPDRCWSKTQVLISSDYTEGFLPRETRWYWASLTGQAETGETVSLNLVEGFNGACECLLWVNQQAYALGEGRFQGQHPQRVWQVTTACGAVDLRFEPWSALWDQTRLGLVNSDFRQVYGSYSGMIQTQQGPLELKGVPGIAEYQAVRW